MPSQQKLKQLPKSKSVSKKAAKQQTLDACHKANAAASNRGEQKRTTIDDSSDEEDAVLVSRRAS
eukprot:6183450-Pleurochrysis_carterae.AAC.1